MALRDCTIKADYACQLGMNDKQWDMAGRAGAS